tara:strand:+ start:125 stop:1600 length:1476 start_codon:yes stop_codon:yes gene_type:complete
MRIFSIICQDLVGTPRETTRRVSASKFLQRENKPTVEGNARKINLITNILRIQRINTGLMLSSLSGGSKGIERDIIDIKETMMSILATLRAQEKFEYQKFLEQQRRIENVRRRQRESLLETSSRGMNIISRGVQKVLTPVTNLFSSILSGFVNLIGGKILQQLVDFLTNPLVSRIIIGFLSFVERFLPIITAGIGVGAIGLIALLARMGVLTPLLVNTARLLIGIPTLGLLPNPLQRTSVGRLGTFREAPLGKKASRFFTNNKAFRRVARRIRFNTGGIVPGSGNTDSVPAMLTPGEVVISKPAVERFGAINLLNLNKIAGSSNKPKIKRGITYANEGMQVPVPNIGELFGAVMGSFKNMEDSDLGKKLSDPAIPETLKTFAESLAISDEQQMNIGNNISRTVSGNLLRKVRESDFAQKIMSDNNKPSNVPNLLPFNKLSEKINELDMSEIFESVLNKVTPQSTTDQSNDVFNIRLNAPNVDKLETLGLIP